MIDEATRSMERKKNQEPKVCWCMEAKTSRQPKLRRKIGDFPRANSCWFRIVDGQQRYHLRQYLRWR